MLSEPRSRLPLGAFWCQPILESGSLNLLTMLTAGVRAFVPGGRKNLRVARISERRSTIICERCGGPGQLCVTIRHWYQTKCPACADAIVDERGDRYRPAAKHRDEES